MRGEKLVTAFFWLCQSPYRENFLQDTEVDTASTNEVDLYIVLNTKLILVIKTSMVV